ncbi:unnamed protein product [Prorocentrum cordatum]|uniref:Uncharacterized protein n=1 Tax=Prorocentrum cordatum TaxID=2364126 RepID=A0ABN9TE71_9DINO|nr:unnamed protein product [Polarella glacialis]
MAEETEAEAFFAGDGAASDDGRSGATDLPTLILPLDVSAGGCNCSTGFTSGGLECRFASRAVRVSREMPPARFVRAQFLFSTSGSRDWWARSSGQAGGISERPLLHLCTERLCSVIMCPPSYAELMHVVDGGKLGLLELRAHEECLHSISGAAWPTDVLGPLEAARAAVVPSRPAAAAKSLPAPPVAGPFDGHLGPASPALSDCESELSRKSSRPRAHFDIQKRGRAGVDFTCDAEVATAAGEPPPKKRSSGDLLQEWAAKLKALPGADAARGSREPAPGGATSSQDVGAGQRELARALLQAMREGKEPASTSELISDGAGSTDPAGAPRVLAGKRARGPTAVVG